MANLDITLKRKVGSTAGVYDVLYPTTTIDQVINLQTSLDAKINTSARGAANGVAPLDSNSRVPIANLPAFLSGASRGFRLISVLNSNTTLNTLVTALSGLTGNGYDSLYGSMWVAGTSISLSWTDQTTLGPVYTYHVLTPGDEADATSPVTLEAGDIIVFTQYLNNTGDGDDEQFTFSIINNTYQNAAPGVFGVTSLVGTSQNAGRYNASTNVDGLQDGHNDVVTENFLYDNIVVDGSQLTSATNLNRIAPAAHHHDSSYLGISATAASASILATARTIAASGDATWSVSFNGSANVSAALTLANSGVTAGTYKSVTVDAKGRVTSGTNPTTLSGYGITDAQAYDADLAAIAALTGTTGFLKKTAADTWSLDTNTYLTGNQTITLSGDATGSGSTSISVTLANSGVTAGTYKSVTVDAKGRVTAGTNPTTLAGYGITDAYTETEVDTLISNTITNRPEIYYNASANSDGDLVIDLDSDGAVA
jgi:hypothetical protein